MKLMAQKLNVIGEQVAKTGLGFSYHNHGFEFEEHDGETGYDIIMSETDSDNVKLELDMYWVIHSAKITPMFVFLSYAASAMRYFRGLSIL